MMLRPNDVGVTRARVRPWVVRSLLEVVMSTTEFYRTRLLAAGTGPTTVERTAEARVRTNTYLVLDRKDPNKDAILAEYKATEADIVTKRAEEAASGNTAQVEVYDAALSVFATWTASLAAPAAA